jgi:hypothetical protein
MWYEFSQGDGNDDNKLKKDTNKYSLMRNWVYYWLLQSSCQPTDGQATPTVFILYISKSATEIIQTCPYSATLC